MELELELLLTTPLVTSVGYTNTLSSLSQISRWGGHAQHANACTVAYKLENF